MAKNASRTNAGRTKTSAPAKPVKPAAASAASAASTVSETSAAEESNQSSASTSATNGSAKGIMQLYWDLASLEPEVRQDAASKLLSALTTFQSEHEASLDSSKPKLATAEADLQELCAPDVAYAVQRLFRGLPSARDGARQGFAMALTELLRTLSVFTTKLGLDLLEKYTSVEPGMKGPEQRGTRFGRLFGCVSIVRSGVLGRASTTLDDYERLVKMLCESGSSKGYMRESIYQTLIWAVDEAVSAHNIDVNSVIMLVLTNMFSIVEGDSERKQKPAVQTPDELLLLIHIQQTVPQFKDWAAVPAMSSWKDHRVISASNAEQLIRILRESSSENPALFSTWRPQPHSIWDTLFNLLTAPSQPSNTVELSTLWKGVVDEHFFHPSSSTEKKFWGLQLITNVLSTPQLPVSFISQVFSVHVLRFLMDNLSSKKKPLHKAAAQTMDALTARVRDATDGSQRQIALALLHQLHDSAELRTFDQATHTKTTETLLQALSADGINDYAAKLCSQFIQPSVDGSSSSKADIASTRTWALDQLHALIRNQQIPKSDQTVDLVLQLLAFHSFFILDSKNAAKGAKDLIARHFSLISGKDLTVTSPALTDLDRKATQQRLFGILGNLATRAPQSTQEKTSEAGTGASSAVNQLLIGCKSDGIPWAAPLATAVDALATVVQKTAKNTKGLAMIEISDSAVHGLTKSVELVKSIQTIISALSKKQQKPDQSAEQRRQLSQMRAYEIMLVHISLMVLIEEEDLVGTVDDLEACYLHFFAPLEALAPAAFTAKRAVKLPPPKLGSVSPTPSSEPTPAEVLIDSIIGLLSRPSALLRSLSERMFVVFAGQMTKASLSAIENVLTDNDVVGDGDDDDDDIDDEDGFVDIDEEDENDVEAAGGSEWDDTDDEDNEDEDEDDDDEDEDDSDMDSDDDNDDDGEIIEEEFKKKLLAALGDAALDVNMNDEDDDEDNSDAANSEDSDDEGPLFTDDQMFATDSHLAAVFRERKLLADERKRQAHEKKMAKIGLDHFRQRVLDLVELFIRRFPRHPLIVDLGLTLLRAFKSYEAKSTASATQLSKRLAGVIANKYCKITGTISYAAAASGDDVDAEHLTVSAEGILEILDEVHTISRRSQHAEVAEVGGLISVFLVRQVLQASRSQSAAQKSNAIDHIVSLYRTIIGDLCTNKTTHLRISFVSNLVEKHPLLAWPLLTSPQSKNAKSADDAASHSISQYIAHESCAWTGREPHMLELASTLLRLVAPSSSSSALPATTTPSKGKSSAASNEEPQSVCPPPTVAGYAAGINSVLTACATILTAAAANATAENAGKKKQQYFLERIRNVCKAVSAIIKRADSLGDAVFDRNIAGAKSLNAAAAQLLEGDKLQNPSVRAQLEEIRTSLSVEDNITSPAPSDAKKQKQQPKQQQQSQQQQQKQQPAKSPATNPKKRRGTEAASAEQASTPLKAAQVTSDKKKPNAAAAAAAAAAVTATPNSAKKRKGNSSK